MCHLPALPTLCISTPTLRLPDSSGVAMATRGSGSLASRHRTVSSIPAVYFWVTGERLNVYGLVLPAAPMKSKLDQESQRRLEPRISAEPAWRVIRSCCRQRDCVSGCNILFSGAAENTESITFGKGIVRGDSLRSCYDISRHVYMAGCNYNSPLKSSANVLEKQLFSIKHNKRLVKWCFCCVSPVIWG